MPMIVGGKLVFPPFDEAEVLELPEFVLELPELELLLLFGDGVEVWFEFCPTLIVIVVLLDKLAAL